ncbi:MAG TPA: TonB-dependent receptor, partial [bacterium]|nr:TonB-dependent receptor [bacterium]
DHVLSQNTFYNLRITSVEINDVAEGPITMRDTTSLRTFGSMPVDEVPHGWSFQYATMWDAMYTGGEGSSGAFNFSTTRTFNVKFDFTSQVNRFNQVKFGFLVNYDDVDTFYESDVKCQPDNHWAVDWHNYPYRGGAYIQDKLEFEGMIANLGVRVDYNNPNTGWYTTDRYSKYFTRLYRTIFSEVAPTEDTESHIRVSPRIGISHPITTTSKLYFNYGHFYSMPQSNDMFAIQYDTDGISRIGNPSLGTPRTVAYELGVESSFGQFLVHLSGYYKDITHQTGDVAYTNFSGTVDYSTPESNNYEDIRGFELRVERRFGEWITGWLNYDYMVETSGYLGREHYYEDQRLQRIEGLQNPKQEKPLPRPVAHAHVMLTTPGDFGGQFGGFRPLARWRLGLLFSYQAGRYQTHDPLETYELQDNLQWKDRYEFDARISKTVRLGNRNLQIYADINNVFNLKYLETLGFEDTIDERSYLNSLHLPMYSGEQYQNAGFVAGDDKPGDLKSDDKPYIDMPNRDFLSFLNPRYITFGFRIDF